MGDLPTNKPHASVIAGAFCFTVFALFLLFRILYWLQIFYDRRKEHGFVQRYSKLVYLAHCSGALYVISRIIGIWNVAFMLEFRTAIWAKSIEHSNAALICIGISGVALFQTLRAWLIFFNCCVAAAASDREWERMISGRTRKTRPIIVTTVDKFDFSHGKDPHIQSTPSTNRLMPKTPSLIGWAKQRSLVLSIKNSSSKVRLLEGINEVGMPMHSDSEISSSNTHINNEQDWYFRHRNDYGKVSWMLRRAYVVWFSYSIIGLILIISSDWMYKLAIYILFLFTIIASSLFFLNLSLAFPRYSDSVKLVIELRNCVWPTLLMFFVYILYGILDQTIPGGRKASFQREYLFWSFCISRAMFCTLLYWLSMCQTKWVCLTFVQTEEAAKKARKNYYQRYMDHSYHHSTMMGGVGAGGKRASMTDSESFLISGIQGQVSEIRHLSAWAVTFWDCSKPTTDAEWLKDYKMREKVGSVLFDANSPSGHAQNMTSMADIKFNDTNELTLQAVLSDELGFRKFMAHLQSEFSTENLLSVIELQQFRHRFHITDSWDAALDDFELFDNESAMKAREERNEKQGFEVSLPESVNAVKSSIVWDRSLDKEEVFVVLCRKYIEENSDTPLNISYHTRRKLLDILDFLLKGTLPKMKKMNHRSKGNESKKKTMNVSKLKERLRVTPEVFKPVIKEMSRLMGDSLARFRNKSDYLLLKHEAIDQLKKQEQHVIVKAPLEIEQTDVIRGLL